MLEVEREVYAHLLADDVLLSWSVEDQPLTYESLVQLPPTLVRNIYIFVRDYQLPKSEPHVETRKSQTT